MDSPHIASLDLQRLGGALLMLVPATLQLGNASVKSTAENNLRAPDGKMPEVAFIHDLFSLPLRAVAEKWYGGMEQAQRLVLNAAPQLPGARLQLVKPNGGLRRPPKPIGSA